MIAKLAILTLTCLATLGPRAGATELRDDLCARMFTHAEEYGRRLGPGAGDSLGVPVDYALRASVRLGGDLPVSRLLALSLKNLRARVDEELRLESSADLEYSFAAIQRLLFRLKSLEERRALGSPNAAPLHQIIRGTRAIDLFLSGVVNASSGVDAHELSEVVAPELAYLRRMRYAMLSAPVSGALMYQSFPARRATEGGGERLILHQILFHDGGEWVLHAYAIRP